MNHLREICETLDCRFFIFHNGKYFRYMIIFVICIVYTVDAWKHDFLSIMTSLIPKKLRRKRNMGKVDKISNTDETNQYFMIYKSAWS